MYSANSWEDLHRKCVLRKFRVPVKRMPSKLIFHNRLALYLGFPLYLNTFFAFESVLSFRSTIDSAYVVTENLSMKRPWNLEDIFRLAIENAAKK